MKLPKIQRPEIEIQFVGIKGFFATLQAICKVGLIKKAHILCREKQITIDYNNRNFEDIWNGAFDNGKEN